MKHVQFASKSTIKAYGLTTKDAYDKIERCFEVLPGIGQISSFATQYVSMTEKSGLKVI